MPKWHDDKIKMKYRKNVLMAEKRMNDELIQNSYNPHSTIWKVIKRYNPSLRKVSTVNLTEAEFNSYFTSIANGFANKPF